MFGQSGELLVLALVLGLALGGGAMWSFFYVISKEEDRRSPHNLIRPHENDVSEAEIELEEEKHSA